MGFAVSESCLDFSPCPQRFGWKIQDAPLFFSMWGIPASGSLLNTPTTATGVLGRSTVRNIRRDQALVFFSSCLLHVASIKHSVSLKDMCNS